jgi:hypothetical protein
MNIKKRKISPTLIYFFEEYKIPDELYVPFLCDGFYETEVLKNKTFYCDFYSSSFRFMWNDLVYNKEVLIKFLQLNKPIDLDLMQQHFLSKSEDRFSTVCLLNFLSAGGRHSLIETPRVCHIETILPELYKPINNLKPKEKTNLTIFQDLTYLSDNQLENCYSHDSFVFISDCDDKIDKTYSAFQIDDDLFVTWKL